MPNETYGPGGYLPGEPNAPDVPRHVPAANLVAWEDVIETPGPDEADPAALVAETLRAVNEGRATDQQIAEVAGIIAGVGGG